METLYDRIKGCIFGQAIGDALGLGTEFMSEREVRLYYPEGLMDYAQIIQDAHRSRWTKGAWTDDTDMMLCIADAIVEDKGKIDAFHIASNFKSWFDGSPMGIGKSTLRVLSMKDYLEDPFMSALVAWHCTQKTSASNGALMRSSILGVIDADKQEVESICRLTHPDPRCIGSCVILTSLIKQLLYHPDSPFDIHQIRAIGDEYHSEFRTCLGFELLRSQDQNYDYDIKNLYLDSKDDMGYTLKTLSAAIWAYFNARSFHDGLYSIVNAGGDADTNAAVACSVLGAKYGFSAIPQGLYQRLIGKERLEKLTEDVFNIIDVRDNKHKITDASCRNS